MNLKSYLRGTVFLAIIACFLWSTAFAGVKIGLNYMSPLQFAGLRFFFAGLMIMLFQRNFKAYFQAFVTHIDYILLVAFLQTILMYGLFYTGINMVPGAVAAMVIGSGPLFAAIVAHFAMHDDKMNLRTTGGIFLGILGIVIINYGRQSTGVAGTRELLGVIILIANNLVSGLYNVVVMKSKRKISMLVLSSASLWVGGLILYLVAIPIEGFQLRFDYPAEFYFSLAWLSFLSAAAFAIWFTLLRRPGVKISHLNTWKFIIPVFGAILSWILLPGESPEVYAITGMLVVASAMLVMNHEAISGFLKKRKQSNDRFV
jgi:drug/metabolite transporter (DMT)-like permease